MTLPYTLGHENAGWVHAIGSAVSHVAPGDTVIVHPQMTCGFCAACRAGQDMHCASPAFPGFTMDGGMASLLKTTDRAVVKLDASLAPKDIAALADAGGTAYHCSSTTGNACCPFWRLRGRTLIRVRGFCCGLASERDDNTLGRGSSTVSASAQALEPTAALV